MTRISDGRIARMEQKVSLKLAEQSVKRKETIKTQRIVAEYHATCVAAIVRGNPKFDEPLNYAWERALKQFKLEVKYPSTLSGLQEAARRLKPVILAGDDLKPRFTELFAPAPGWLLRFTRTGNDCLFLGFNLPLAWGKEKWGIIGFDAAKCWPRLPLATMGSGDPISENDYIRKMELSMMEMALLGWTQEMQRHLPTFKKL